MKVKLYLPDAAKIVRTKGLGADGAVQREHTKNVLNRIQKYMPYRTSATQKLTVAQTNVHKPEIVTDVPYARYLYHGKVMVDPRSNAPGFMTPEGWRSRKGSIKKVATNRDLRFNKHTGHEGPRWDRALSANEGKAMAADLQRFINRRSK